MARLSLLDHRRYNTFQLNTGRCHNASSLEGERKCQMSSDSEKGVLKYWKKKIAVLFVSCGKGWCPYLLTIIRYRVIWKRNFWRRPQVAGIQVRGRKGEWKQISEWDMANVPQMVPFTSSGRPLSINNPSKSQITKDETLPIRRDSFAHFYLVWHTFSM